MEKQLILCMGRNRRNQELLGQVLEKAGYAVAIAQNYEALEDTISQESVALVLLDIAGFDSGVWQQCERLRSQTIPFLLIAPPHSTRFLSQYNARSDRVPLLIKPLSIQPLLTLVSHTLQL